MTFGLFLFRGGRRGSGLLVIAGLTIAGAGIGLNTALTRQASALARRDLGTYWRTDYDILVRPASGMSAVDAYGTRLIEPNTLAGSRGGITLAQYEQIKDLPGVEVAAPVAVVGHFPVGFLTWGKEVSGSADDAWEAYRDVRTITISNGWQEYSVVDETYTVYDRRDELSVDSQGLYLVSPDGERYSVAGTLPDPTRPGEVEVRILGRSMSVHPDGTPSGHVYNAQVDLYLLVAGIDPAEEDALLGVGSSVSSGRYLNSSDAPDLGGSFGDEWLIPVLVRDSTSRQMDVEVVTYSLSIPASHDLAQQLAESGLDYLQSLTGEEVGRQRESLTAMYALRIDEMMARGQVVGFMGGMFWTYLQPGPIEYLAGSAQPNYEVSLVTRTYGLSDWSPLAGVMLTPAQARYRDNRPEQILLEAEDGFHLQHFTFVPVGLYRMPVFVSSSLNQVPLETYFPPTAVLRYEPDGTVVTPVEISATGDPAGYLSDPPLILTTLETARFLSQREDFISAVRVRVGGVGQLGEEAQARINGVASEISARTGLQADVTLGSSPQRVLVEVPGYGEAHGLGFIEELWVRQLAGISIFRRLNAIESAFTVSFLTAAGLLAFSVASASLQARRSELVLLGKLGWRSKDVLKGLLGDALAAGIASTLIAVVVVWVVLAAIEVERPQVVDVFPLLLVFVLAPGAAVLAAWRGSGVRENSLVTPEGTRADYGPGATSYWRYSLRSLLGNWRILGLAALAPASVSALVVFVVVSIWRTRDLMSTSLLGEYVASEIHPYHAGLVIMAIVVSVLATGQAGARVVTERRREIGLLLGIGWRPSHISRVFMWEGLLIGAVSGLAGSTLGLGGSFVLSTGPVPPLGLILGLGIGVAALLGGIGFVYPSRLAAATSVIAVMRSE